MFTNYKNMYSYLKQQQNNVSQSRSRFPAMNGYDVIKTSYYDVITS